MGEIPGSGLLPLLVSRAPLASGEVLYTIKQTTNHHSTIMEEDEEGEEGETAVGSSNRSRNSDGGANGTTVGTPTAETEVKLIFADGSPLRDPDIEPEVVPLCDYNDAEPGRSRDERSDSVFERSDCERLERQRSQRTSGKRKESLEKRLRRRFTIKDEHTSLVTKRIIAIVIKYSLFVFNFCSWVIASIAIGIGLWVLTDKGRIVTDGRNFFLDPTIMIVIGGGITFVVAFLGCLGALRENLVLLRVFFIILSVILVGEVIGGVSVFVLYVVPEARANFLHSTPEKVLKAAILRYMDDADTKIWMDIIQQEFRCCGIGLSKTDEGFRDWQMNLYFNCTENNLSVFRCAVPMSCCIFEPGDRINTMCGFRIADKALVDVRDYIYTRGCIHGFGEWLSKHDELIVIAALSILVMQVFAVISAHIMVRRISRQRHRWHSLHRASTSSS